MDRAAYLAALRRDTQAFATAIDGVGLQAPVPSCPEWNTGDLVHHVSQIFAFWGSIIAERATSRDAVQRVGREPDDRLMDAYRRHAARLLEVLEDTDPSTEVWTWSSQHDVAFILRRMAQEIGVHRWDADDAAGHRAPIEAELASDGIDEFLVLFLDGRPEKASVLGGSVHIHCGDVAGEWTIRPTGDGLSVSREHAKGDCALRGRASDLLLALWRRIGVDALDVVGDRDVAERFLGASDLE